MQVDEIEELMHAKPVAEALGIHVGSLHRMWRKGNGPPFVRVGRLRRVSPSALREWVANGGNRDRAAA